MTTAQSGLMLDGYVRVSEVGLRRGPRFISPVVQREAIEAWADARGARLLEIFIELDESGGRADRPQLAIAVERIEIGASQGLVVWKVDRFSRSLIDGLQIIKRVKRAGGEFFSVRDGFDTSTESGRLMLRFLLAMGETDLERMSANWEIAQLKVIERGGYSGSYPPVGYRRTRTTRLRPNPVTAPTVTELFRLRADGWSMRRLCRWLEERGVVTAKGNPGWTESTLAHLIRSRVYLGEVSWDGHVHVGAHTALTDPATWQVAQRPRQRTVEWSERPSLLAGLVRCASCSMTLSATPRRDDDGDRVRRYVCRGHSAAGRCPGPASMSTDYLEPYIETAALELLHRRRRAPEAALTAAQEQLATAEAQLATYRDSPRLLRMLGEADFASGVQVRAHRAREARGRVAAVRARHAVHALPPTAEIESRWSDMDLDAKREVIASVLDCVFVAPGRLEIEQRVTICPVGTAPARLPRAGDKGGRARPFTPRHGLLTASTERPAYLWSRSRVERELRPFVRGREAWPSRAEFYEAGLARLHINIVLRAGEHWWAYRFGLRVAGGTARARWTDDRIRDTLTLYLADKKSWPSLGDFDRDGMFSLRQAIITTGGVARWAPQFPHVPPVRRKAPDVGWNEDRVRRELAAVLQGRGAFPTRREFRSLDRESLYTALAHRGGVDRWAREFRVPRVRDVIASN